MVRDYSFLARSADVGPDGTLTVAGGDLRTVRCTPPDHLGRLSLVASFALTSEECQSPHITTAEVLAPNGMTVAANRSVLNPISLPVENDARIIVLFEFGQLPLREVGRYTVQWRIGAEERRNSLQVTNGQQGCPTPPATRPVDDPSGGVRVFVIPSASSEVTEQPVNPWVEKTAEFARLHDGWDGARAPAPSSQAISSALLCLSVMAHAGVEPARVAPARVGGVGLTLRNGGRKVYVEFSNHGSAHALFADDTTEDILKTCPVPIHAHGLRTFIADANEYLNG